MAIALAIVGKCDTWTTERSCVNCTYQFSSKMISSAIKEIFVLFGKTDEIDTEFDIFYRYKVHVVKLAEDPPQNQLVSYH